MRLIAWTVAFAREFRVCAKAIFAFGAGYKLGEGYTTIGKALAGLGKRADAEAWQEGYHLAARRHHWWPQ